jgi:hypothetical protein
MDNIWRQTAPAAQCGAAAPLTAEGHMGELMDVLAPALSASSRARRPKTSDAFARNEALLLLHLLAYEVLHSGRCVMEVIA